MKRIRTSIPWTLLILAIILIDIRERVYQQNTDAILVSIKQSMVAIKDYTQEVSKDRVTRKAVLNALNEIIDDNNLNKRDPSFLEDYLFIPNIEYPEIPK